MEIRKFMIFRVSEKNKPNQKIEIQSPKIGPKTQANKDFNVF